jgi:hypothetical protein
LEAEHEGSVDGNEAFPGGVGAEGKDFGRVADTVNDVVARTGETCVGGVGVVLGNGMENAMGESTRATLAPEEVAGGNEIVTSDFFAF